MIAEKAVSAYGASVMVFPRPVVVASSCLEFEKVRYNGEVIASPLVRDLTSFVTYKRVCPEYAIGLGVPRDPIRIVKVNGAYRLIQHKTNRDVTEAMNRFVSRFLADLAGEAVDGFIFKSKSPTMGLYNIKVYSGMKGGTVVERCGGFFAGKVAKTYEGHPIEEDQRLRNKVIRNHFLTRLFVCAGFRKAKETAALDEFHAHNQLLFSFYNKAEAAELSVDGDDFFDRIKALMKRPPPVPDVVRFFQDLAPHIDKKDAFLAVVEKYRDNKISFEAVREIARYGLAGSPLAETSFFRPYPEALQSASEDDRARDYWQ